MAYASLADLTTYLGIDESTADDGLLSQLLARAQAAIDTYTRRTFEATADVTRWHTLGNVWGRQLAFDGDICAITSITNGDGATVAASEYHTLPFNRTPYYAVELWRDSVTAWDADSGGQIAVTGRWAYSTTPPADITHACVRLAAWMYRQKDNTAGDTPIIAGDVTILPARFPSDVQMMLAPYRRAVL